MNEEELLQQPKEPCSHTHTGIFSSASHTLFSPSLLPPPSTLIVKRGEGGGEGGGDSEALEDEGGKGIVDLGGEKSGLIVELDSSNATTTTTTAEQERKGVKVSAEGWAMKPSREKRSQSTMKLSGKATLVVEDMEEPALESAPHCVSPPHRLVPAVKDPAEITAAEEALERISQKSAEELTQEDKVWLLAAKGGSTLASDEIHLDRETTQRLKQTLAKKSRDKTTLAF